MLINRSFCPARFKRKSSVSIDAKPFLEGPSIKQAKLEGKKDEVVIESGPIEYASVKDGEYGVPVHVML
jgi:hypothetical protein